jgi:hypothetical protein
MLIQPSVHTNSCVLGLVFRVLSCVLIDFREIIKEGSWKSKSSMSSVVLLARTCLYLHIYIVYIYKYIYVYMYIYTTELVGPIPYVCFMLERAELRGL